MEIRFGASLYSTTSVLPLSQAAMPSRAEAGGEINIQSPLGLVWCHGSSLQNPCGRNPFGMVRPLQGRSASANVTVGSSNATAIQVQRFGLRPWAIEWLNRSRVASQKFLKRIDVVIQPSLRD